MGIGKYFFIAFLMLSCNDTPKFDTTDFDKRKRKFDFDDSLGKANLIKNKKGFDSVLDQFDECTKKEYPYMSNIDSTIYRIEFHAGHNNVVTLFFDTQNKVIHKYNYFFCPDYGNLIYPEGYYKPKSKDSCVFFREYQDTMKRQVVYWDQKIVYKISNSEVLSFKKQLNDALGQENIVSSFSGYSVLIIDKGNQLKAKRHRDLFDTKKIQSEKIKQLRSFLSQKCKISNF
jgi:hypothetical protein